jgi:uncharacterized protein with PIN domain
VEQADVTTRAKQIDPPSPASHAMPPAESETPEVSPEFAQALGEATEEYLHTNPSRIPAVAQEGGNDKSTSTVENNAPWDSPPNQAGSSRASAALFPRSPSVSLGVRGALAAGRAAMARRDLATARQQLSEAAGRATTMEDRDEVERVQLMWNQLSRFWTAVEDSLRQVRPGQVLSYRGVEVTVSSVGPGSLTLSAPNGDQKSFSSVMATMDPELAYGLAARQLGMSGPMLWMMAGTFWAADGQGDPDQARELWAKAGQQGLAVGALGIDAAQLVSAGRFADAPGGTTAEGGGPDTAATAALVAATAPGKRPVPSAADRAKALKEIHSLFHRQYAARDPEEKQKFAAQLVKQGLETDGDAAARYVLLSEAMETARQVADAEMALRAMDALAASFQVDGDKMRLDLLSSFLRTAGTDEQRKGLLDLCVALAQKAVDKDDYEFALRCMGLALSVARKTGSDELQMYVKRRRAQIEYARKQYAETRTAAARLAGNSHDADANLAMGKFFCFAKGDFERGLPLLAKGADQDLKQLAQRELGQLQDAQAQAELADAWWELASDENDQAKMQILDHARKWYEKAHPHLKGIAKTRVETRLGQLAPESETPSLPAHGLLAALMGQVGTIHFDNDRQWKELRFFPDGRWGYNGKIVGGWSIEDGAVIAPWANNPAQRLVFRAEGQAITVVYVTDGKLNNRGVVRPAQ